jgi:hypothetical protein
MPGDLGGDARGVVEEQLVARVQVLAGLGPLAGQASCLQLEFGDAFLDHGLQRVLVEVVGEGEGEVEGSAGMATVRRAASTRIRSSRRPSSVTR